MIIKRILQYIEYKGINKHKFYIQTGLSNGFLDKVKDIGTSKIEIIYSIYPEINLEWLITGKGEMLKKEIINNENLAAEPIEKYKKADNEVMLELIKQNRELTNELCDCREELGSFKNNVNVKSKNT